MRPLPNQGRGPVARAASALAAGLLVLITLWVFRHLLPGPENGVSQVSSPVSGVALQPTHPATSQPTSVPDFTPAINPTRPSVTVLTSSDGQLVLYLFDAGALVHPPASGALQNVGFRLGSSDGNPHLVVEVGSDQTALDPASAPSIYIPAQAQPGDRVWLFAATSLGRTTPAAEFTLEQREGRWYAERLQQADKSPTLRVEIPTPAAESADLFKLTPLAPGPEVSMRLERVYITPEQPHQGQPFTVTAVIHNLGDEEARVPAWIGAFRPQGPYLIERIRTYYVDVPAGGKAEFDWDGRDQSASGPATDISLENPHLEFRAGVNLIVPGGWPRLNLHPEEDRRDNQARLLVSFLPYEPEVSDACPRADNLWLELDQGRAYQEFPRQSALRLIVHNEGHVEVVKVPLRITVADGRQFLTYARRVPPCGGAVGVDALGIAADRLSYPISVTLNPPDAPGAMSESHRGDNVLIVWEDAACTGDTDLWLASEDVVVDGDDLLVTVHLSGNPPERSFVVQVYHTDGGRLLTSRRVIEITCAQPLTLRFEGILSGLSGGYGMVQIDTEANRVEAVYPQHNNSTIVPLP
jgi:hypothetical protein